MKNMRAKTVVKLTVYVIILYRILNCLNCSNLKENEFTKVVMVNSSRISMIKRNSTKIQSAKKSQVKINSTKIVSNEKDITNFFKKVTPDSSIFVYSAYLEERSYILRIIGVTKLRNNSHIRCILHYKLRPKLEITDGYIKHIPENHHTKYTAMFILCNMKGKDAPDTVSFDYKNSTVHFPHEIKVVRITQRANQYNFTSCVSPLHSMYSDTTQLIEWIELNRLLGVEKFIFYINHISKKVLKVLEYYERKNLLSLLPWNIPRYMAYQGSAVHYFGQLAALNDCLYRYKGRSKYISSTDLDEFIIPQKPHHMTWSDMMAALPPYSAYIVRSSFFRKSQTCSKNEICKNGITIDTYRLRDVIILETHKRSKYIAKTNDLIVMGIHFTWELHTGREYTVKPEIALVHHYRKLYKRYTVREPVKVPHTAANKYSVNLKKNIKNVTAEILQINSGLS